MTRRPIPIAYVEDDARDVRELRQLFEQWHVINRIDDYPSGEYFLRCLRTGACEPPGIILVDMLLGEGLDGLGVIKAIRAGHADLPAHLPQIPLVIVTGADDEASIAVAEKAGADAYIVKPVTMPSLMKAVNEAAPFRLEIVRVEQVGT